MSKSVKKPAFMFIFRDSQTAERFLSEANRHSDVAYAQHPLIGDGSVARNTLKVLVTSKYAVGRNNNLIGFLWKRAMEMGGYYLPSQNVIEGI